MCTFYLDDQKYRKDLEVLVDLLDRQIHRAIELDQLILLQIGLLQEKIGKSGNPENSEDYEAISSRTQEVGQILQEIRKKLHTDLLTLDAVREDVIANRAESSEEPSDFMQ
jgi:hypothetical protein